MIKGHFLVQGKALTLDIADEATIEQTLRGLGYPSRTFLARAADRFLPTDAPVPDGVVVEILFVRDVPSGFFGSAGITGARVDPPELGAATGSAVSVGPAPLLRIPSCDFCGRPAVTCDSFVASAANVMRVHRCEECFLAEMRRRVLGVCRWYGLVEPGSHVLVPLSGGKDSAAELFFLREFAGEVGGVRLTAYTLVMGKHKCFELGVARAAELAAGLGVPHVVVDLAACYGMTLEEAVAGHPESKVRFGPCAVCAATRRLVERDLVARLSVTAVSTGETRTDQRRHLFWGVFQHTRWQKVSFPRRADPVQGTVRMSPLFDLDDHETALLARLLDLPVLFHQDGDCPLSEFTFRAGQTDIIERLEDVYPGLFLQTRERVLGLLRSEDVETDAEPCPTCGEEVSAKSRKCFLCATLAAFGLALPRTPDKGYPRSENVAPSCPDKILKATHLLRPGVRWVARVPDGWLLFAPERGILRVSARESTALLAGRADDASLLSRFTDMGLLREVENGNRR
jgi:tRNA(Ile)-lysidine synthase TilS/MesJ